MLNLDKCAISSELCRTWRRQRNHLLFFSGYAIIFAHKGKSNTSFGTVNGLLLFVCTHNINKTLCFYKIKKTIMCFLPSRLEQEHFTKEPKLTEYMLHTDMINISIERFKLLLEEIKQIENKNSFILIIICKDGLLSKGGTNEEMARICNFILATPTQKNMEGFSGLFSNRIANCIFNCVFHMWTPKL